jgi:hypothetical protein
MVAGADDRVDRYHTRLECHRSIFAEGWFFIREIGGKTMTSEMTITDDRKAVERWENEGGHVSVNNLRASLKSFTTEGLGLKGRKPALGPGQYRNAVASGEVSELQQLFAY